MVSTDSFISPAVRKKFAAGLVKVLPLDESNSLAN